MGLAAAGDLTESQHALADRIEAALGRAGQRGLSPAQAARHVRCTAAQAEPVLAYLVAHQFAYTDRHGHYYAGCGR